MTSRISVQFLISLMLVIAGAQTVAARQVLRNDYAREPHERYFERMAQSPRIPKTTNLLPRPLNLMVEPDKNITTDPLPQNEPSVRVSRLHPNRAVAAWRDFRTGSDPAIRRVGYSYTTDAGVTWSPVTLLFPFNGTYPRASDPAVTTDLHGNFYIATISIRTDDNYGKIIVYKSTDEGVTFSSAAIAPAADDTSNAFFDDKEYITCNLNPASLYANFLYISWTRFGSPGGMFLTLSADGGNTWTDHIPISDPGNAGQGSDPCVAPNGDVCVAWMGGWGIMFDKSTDGGFTFGTDVLIDTLHGYDYQSFPSIAADESGGPRRGTLYATYADDRNGDEDVFLSKSTDGGASWSKAVRVNNDPIANGKDQFWPWLTVDDNGIVSIVFYDCRNTPNNAITETYIAHSYDGGATFVNELVSAAQSARNTPNGAVRYGDYIGIDAWGSNVVPVWTDERSAGFNMEIYSAPRNYNTPVTITTNAGWNLASVPIQGTTFLKTNIFPGAISPAFAYNGSYTICDTLVSGPGYWLRYAGASVESFLGTPLTIDSVALATGWNLIGALGAPIASGTLTTNPPGILASQFFGYQSGYAIADSLFPGSGYWVKASSGGTLRLSTSGATVAQTTYADRSAFSSIHFSNGNREKATLYLAQMLDEKIVRRFELPPAVPAQTLDVRFPDGGMLADVTAARFIPISLNNSLYPLNVTWDGSASPPGLTLKTDDRSIPLNTAGSLQLFRKPSVFGIAAGAAAAENIPSRFNLYQNYPNPFNPATEIRYDLPAAADVHLQIFSILGEEIASPVREFQPAGVHRISWNAGQIPSGIYYYRLTAGSYQESRKLVLIR